MKIKIIELDTDYGIKIIDDLKSKGWKQTKQYSPFAFDKGIDFDSYTLKKLDSNLSSNGAIGSSGR